MGALIFFGVLLSYLTIGMITARVMYVLDVVEFRDAADDMPGAIAIPILCWWVVWIVAAFYFPIKGMAWMVTRPTRTQLRVQREREQSQRQYEEKREAERLARKYSLPKLPDV